MARKNRSRWESPTSQISVLIPFELKIKLDNYAEKNTSGNRSIALSIMIEDFFRFMRQQQRMKNDDEALKVLKRLAQGDDE